MDITITAGTAITFSTSNYGDIRISDWKGRRAYINASYCNNGQSIGYVDYATRKLVATGGNKSTPGYILAALNMDAVAITAHFIGK